MSQDSRGSNKDDKGLLETVREDGFRAIFGAKMKELEGIPGPAPTLPLGNAGDFLGAFACEVLAGYAERYGAMTLFWTLGKPNILITDPELVWEVLEGDFDRYYKDAPREALLPILAESCEFISNGEAWRRARDADPVGLVAPAPATPGGAAPPTPPLDLTPTRSMLVERVRALVEETAANPCDLRPKLARLAFDALSLQMTGTTLGDEAYAEYAELTAVGSDRINAPVALPFEVDVKAVLARRRWRARMAEVVAAARGDLASGKRDVLRSALRRGTPLDDETLALQIGCAFFGGTQSIAASVLSTLYLLSQHPEVAARVRAEVRGLLERDPGHSYAALNASPELDHALLEALRLFPPAAVYMRNAQKSGPVELGGRRLPADTTIYITPWPMQRSRARWEDAERFHPERWANGGKARDPLGSGYFFPFGRGRRTCAGQTLALINVKLTLEAILTGALPELGIGQPYDPELFFGVLLPKKMIGRFAEG